MTKQFPTAAYARARLIPTLAGRPFEADIVAAAERARAESNARYREIVGEIGEFGTEHGCNTCTGETLNAGREAEGRAFYRALTTQPTPGDLWLDGDLDWA